MVIVRPVSPLDELARFGEVHGVDADTPRRRRTLVAEVAGSVWGAGTIVWSNRHPDIVSAHLDVAATPPGHDVVGQALLAGLHDAADRPLMFNLVVLDPEVVSDHSTVELLAANGYRPVVDSTTVRCSVDLVRRNARRGRRHRAGRDTRGTRDCCHVAPPGCVRRRR